MYCQSVTIQIKLKKEHIVVYKSKIVDSMSHNI